MRLSGIDSLQRGISNLLANWELALMSLAQTFLVSVLVVAGSVPIVLAVGVGPLRALFEADFDHERPPIEAIEQLTESILESSGQLLLATLVAAVVWTVALVVLAYFQAGVFGILAESDRRAPHPNAKRHTFRVFSLARFRASADAFMWRFFWLINLFMVFALVPLLIFGAGAVLAVWLATSGSVGGAMATGCLGTVAVIATSFLCSLWWQLSMAAAVAGPSAVWKSIGQGFTVLLRRFGAVLVLVLLAIVAGMTIAIVFVPLGIVAEVISRDSLLSYIAAQVIMTIVQSLFSAVIGIAFSGALVALARGELAASEIRPA